MAAGEVVPQELADVAAGSATRAAAKFVKVTVDSVPYLCKVNLQDYAGYDPLLRALEDKFANDETKLVDGVNGMEYGGGGGVYSDVYSRIFFKSTIS